MPRPTQPTWHICATPGCPNTIHGTNTKCPQHQQQAEHQRGNPRQRGYNTRQHQTFRTAVLNRDLICTLCGIQPATEADHYPHSRTHLTTLGLNPNNPKYGRGLCKQCHSKETAKHQPGGWNQ